MASPQQHFEASRKWQEHYQKEVEDIGLRPDDVRTAAVRCPPVAGPGPLIRIGHCPTLWGRYETGCSAQPPASMRT